MGSNPALSAIYSYIPTKFFFILSFFVLLKSLKDEYKISYSGLLTSKIKSNSLYKFSNLDIIKRKKNDKIHLFGRGNLYKRVNIDESYPDYILNNNEKLKEWIF